MLKKQPNSLAGQRIGGRLRKQSDPTASARFVKRCQTKIKSEVRFIDQQPVKERLQLKVNLCIRVLDDLAKLVANSCPSALKLLKIVVQSIYPSSEISHDLLGRRQQFLDKWKKLAGSGTLSFARDVEQNGRRDKKRSSIMGSFPKNVNIQQMPSRNQAGNSPKASERKKRRMYQRLFP
jgi:hypothetical protein